MWPLGNSQWQEAEDFQEQEHSTFDFKSFVLQHCNAPRP